MKIAVTGSNGFVGSRVSACLANQLGIEVTLCQRNDPETTIVTNFRCVKFNMADADEYSYEMLGKPDLLIHLAWGGLPNYNSDSHLQHELPLQIKFLTHLIKSGLKRLVVTGTCYEYGMQSGELSEISEIAPITQYGRAKSSLHAALEKLKITHEFELVWLRLFYLYGQGQSKSSLFSQFKSAIENQQSTFDMSGGNQIRDFLPAEEAAKRIVAIALLTGTSGTFNLCSGIPIKVKDLVGLWIVEHNSTIKLNLGFYPYPAFEPMEFWGNANKLNRLIGLK